MPAKKKMPAFLMQDKDKDMDKGKKMPMKKKPMKKGMKK